MGNIEFTRKPKALLSCPNVINLHLYTLSIRPRILVDVSRIDMSTSILGYKLSAPIMVAPTAMHQLAHPEGEVATARGAAACNTIMVLSFNSTCTMEEVASSCDVVLFLQLYGFNNNTAPAGPVFNLGNPQYFEDDLKINNNIGLFTSLMMNADAPVYGTPQLSSSALLQKAALAGSSSSSADLMKSLGSSSTGGAEIDEFIYHECLIHPSLLCHPNPKSMFIMGGGEGSAVREALKHKSIEKVVMCDIDEEVVDFCRRHLSANKEAFSSTKLNLVINDAKVGLEESKEKFDIIVGDLADPVEGGPCYQLYTKSFYEKILKPKLNHNGIFVTQAGPAGVFTHKEVFSSIYNTIRQVFKYVVVYTAHVPSFADTWGWVMASDQPLCVDAVNIDNRIQQRIEGELDYLNGAMLHSSTILNKTISQTLKNETHVYTEETARFIPGHGVTYCI